MLEDLLEQKMEAGPGLTPEEQSSLTLAIAKAVQEGNKEAAEYLAGMAKEPTLLREVLAKTGGKWNN